MIKLKQHNPMKKDMVPAGRLAEPINCICGRKFSYIGNYYYHQRQECGRKLQCPKCTKSFTTVHGLKYHTRVAH